MECPRGCDPHEFDPDRPMNHYADCCYCDEDCPCHERPDVAEARHA